MVRHSVPNLRQEGAAPIPADGPGSPRLRVVVPYTSPELTRVALGAAQNLAEELSAELTLVAVQVVPFPCPLDRPSVDPAHFERQLVSVAGTVGSPVRIQIVRARDERTGFQSVLRPRSLIFMATKRRPWPTREERLRRSFMNSGHSVALLPV